MNTKNEDKAADNADSHLINKLSYAWIAIPIAMLGLPIYIYLPSYYSSAFSVDLSIIGIALLLARVIDVFTDPLIGVWSDKLQSTISRSNQILLGSLALVIFIYPLFLPFSDYVGGIYLFILSFFSYFAWTLIQVPYMAMAAELKTASKNRREYIAWREAATIIGVVIMLLLPFIVGYQVTEQAFYIWFVVLFSMLLLLGALLLKRLVRQPEVSKDTHGASTSLKSKGEQKPFFKQLIMIKEQHPEALLLLPPYFINNLAAAIPATLFLIFVEQYLQLNEQAGLFLLVYFLAGILSLPLWLKLANKYGRITVWRASILLSIVSFLLVFGLQQGDANLYLAICLLTGLSVAVDIALPASMQADISHQIEQKTENVHGLLFGIWGMLTKLSLALAVGLSLPVVDWLQDQAIADEMGMLLLYALPAILLKGYVWVNLKRIQTRLEKII